MNHPTKTLLTIALAGLLLPFANATAQTPTKPTFDLPELPDLILDGDAGEWGDEGFKVRVLFPTDGTISDGQDFHPEARFAWDERGLLLCVEVEDDAAIEGAREAPWTGDSVELFVAAGAESKQGLQVVAVPGRDGPGATATLKIVDNRADKSAPAEVEMGAKSRDRGYTIEMRIPWPALGVKPENGAEFFADLQVNDRDLRAGGRRKQVTWFTEGWAGTGPAFMHHLRLADKASPPDAIVAGSRLTPNLRDAKVLVVAAPALAGGKVVVRRGEKSLREGTLSHEGSYATARCEVPAEAKGEAQPIVVSIGDRELHRLGSQDGAAQRRQAVEQARLRVRPVFTGAALPDIEFETPGWIETLLGAYTTSTTYYDATSQVVTSAEKPGRYGAITRVEAQGAEPILLFTTLYRAASDQKIDWSETHLELTRLPEMFGFNSDLLEREKSALGNFVQGEITTRLSHESSGAVLLAALAESAGNPEPMRTGTDPWSRDQAWWLALKKKLGLFHHRYHVSLPAGYDDPANAAKRWPLILFLHGSGERGNDAAPVPIHGPATVKVEGEPLPFIIVSPQCEPGQWWNAPRVVDVLDEALGRFRADADRVYLTGLSMGGYGAWFTAESAPERFAAVAPLCGGGEPDDAARLSGLPIWAFHGDADKSVPIQNTQAMVDAIRAAGGKSVAFTVYPGVGHDCWTASYALPQLYEWFLANRRGTAPVLPTTEGAP